MGVGHGRADVVVAEQLLDGPDVGDPGDADRRLHGTLEDRFVQMVPSALARDAVGVDPGGRENPLAMAYGSFTQPAPIRRSCWCWC